MILVDLDVATELREQILVEREGFAFFVDIEYERLPLFCYSCGIIGHSLVECRKCGKTQDLMKDQTLNSKKPSARYVPKKVISNNPQDGVVMPQVDLVHKGKGIMIENSPWAENIVTNPLWGT